MLKQAIKLLSCYNHTLNKHPNILWYKHRSLSDLTQTTELADDGGQRVVGYTFQLVANPIRHCTVAQVPRLNVSLYQRHDPLSHLDHSTCWGTEDSLLSTSKTCTATINILSLFHKNISTFINHGVLFHALSFSFAVTSLETDTYVVSCYLNGI